jgi:hypothetical protein
MPTNIEAPRTPGDWLKREADSLYSREQVLVVSGAGIVKSGTVLGKITASGKYKVNTIAASDGSQTASAILLHDVDATSADAQAVIIARDAIVAHQALIHGSDVDTANERAAVNAALAAVGILVREGA